MWAWQRHVQRPACSRLPPGARPAPLGQQAVACLAQGTGRYWDVACPPRSALPPQPLQVLGAGATFTQTVIGTPYYMSPELCDARRYGAKADVWALGVVLYECCTGRHPFTATSQVCAAARGRAGERAPILIPLALPFHCDASARHCGLLHLACSTPALPPPTALQAGLVQRILRGRYAPISGYSAE